MAALKNTDYYTAIHKCKDLIEICRPLNQFEITYFNHIKIFDNGAKLSLGNNPYWLEHFFKNKYYNKGNFSGNYKNLHSDYILWYGMPNDGVAEDAKNNFAIDNGITFIVRNNGYTNLFLFASTPNNLKINNFYINNIDILQHFIYYYNEKSIKIINSCQQDIPSNRKRNEPTSTLEIAHHVTEEERRKFILEIPIKKYRIELNGKQLSISSREYECIDLLSKGKSIKEISLILNLSPRTIYFYLDNVKCKLNCSTKSELLRIASGLNLF